MPRILAPHKEQDGWVYVRVARCEAWFARFLDLDYSPERRIISSRRVEQDVETGDYLRLCDDEGAWVVRKAGEWAVSGKGGYASGTTLREAYHRYKNANA